MPLGVIFLIWAGAVVAGLFLQFVKTAIDARLAQSLQRDIRQRIHDHLQSLSLDFFTGEPSGSLMQRVLMEASSVQRLLTQSLIPPIVEIVVLVLALLYLLVLSWQMTIVALACCRRWRCSPSSTSARRSSRPPAGW